MNKTIITIMVCMMMLPMALAIAPAPNGECYKYEPVRLMTGWNGVGIIPYYENLSTGDVTIELNPFSNTDTTLVGFSALRSCTPVTSLSFYDGVDTKNYNDAVSTGWVTSFVITDETDQTGENLNNVCPYEAYWIKVDRDLNITYSGIYASPVEDTFPWEDIRFSNGTNELNITNATSENWVNSIFQFWGEGARGVYSLQTLDSGTVNATIGYFVQSLENNIYLLTNNETKPCRARPNIKPDLPRLNGVCYNENAVPLDEGLNGISIIPYEDNVSLRTVTFDLANASSGGEFNLVGASFKGCIPINQVQFYDYDGNKKAYNTAVNDGWIDEITQAGDVLSTSGKSTKNKICFGESYWVESYLATNMSYENVEGSPKEIFNWSNLKISNGTEEKTFLDAKLNLWLGSEILYWDTNANAFRSIGDNLDDYDRIESMYSYEGFVVNSNLDNIYLLTANSTSTCRVKPKFHAKVTANGRVEPKIHTTWITRLIGMMRDTQG